MNATPVRKKPNVVPSPNRAEELAGVLERLIDLQVSLHAVLRGKLEAMRRVDRTGMLTAAQKEGEIVAQTAVLDRQRHEVVLRLCAALGMAGGGGLGRVTLRMLQARLPLEARRRIGSLAERLQAEMLRVAEANRTVELVCREMMTHFKAMFTALVHDGASAPTYSADGEVGPATGARVLDAMG